MVRELTPGEERRLLTQEQVDALPNGTVVYVKWTGGNGPHMYIIRQHNGKAYALTEREIREGGGFIPASDRRIDPVGSHRAQTRVFLPVDQEADQCSD